MRWLGLAIFSVLLLASPVLALGILKIEVPSKATVGEEVTIRVVDSLTGDPVEGVTVYINGIEVGTTNENGEITYTFDSPGIYVIGATKFGYTPAVSVSLSVESETVETPSPIETPEIKSYSGLVFTQDLFNDLFGVLLSAENLEISDLIKQAEYVKPISPGAFFTDGRNYMILYGDFEITESGYYKIEGYSLGAEVQFKGRTWKLFEVTSIEKLSPETVSVEDLVGNPINYAGKEIIVSGPFREVSFEIESLVVPVDIGSVSTVPVDIDGFVKELIDAGKKFEKSPDAETIEELTNFAGVMTFRVDRGLGVGIPTQAYWKAVNAELQGLVIPADIAYLVLPPEISKLLTKRGVIILLKNVDIPAERASVEEIRQNQEKYIGKVVEVPEVYTFAKSISVKDLVSTVFPPAQSSPVDIYFEPNIMFDPPMPKPNNILFGFGVAGFEQNYIGSEQAPVFDAKYTLKGIIISASMLNKSLPSEPMIVIFERTRHTVEDYAIPFEDVDDLVNMFNTLSGVLSSTGLKEISEKSVTMPAKSPTTPEEKKLSEGTSESGSAVSIPREVKTPGFEAVAGLLALGTGVNILQRRKK